MEASLLHSDHWHRVKQPLAAPHLGYPNEALRFDTFPTLLDRQGVEVRPRMYAIRRHNKSVWKNKGNNNYFLFWGVEIEEGVYLSVMRTHSKQPAFSPQYKILFSPEVSNRDIMDLLPERGKEYVKVVSHEKKKNGQNLASSDMPQGQPFLIKEAHAECVAPDQESDNHNEMIMRKKWNEQINKCCLFLPPNKKTKENFCISEETHSYHVAYLVSSEKRSRLDNYELISWEGNCMMARIEQENWFMWDFINQVFKGSHQILMKYWLALDPEHACPMLKNAMLNRCLVPEDQWYASYFPCHKTALEDSLARGLILEAVRFVMKGGASRKGIQHAFHPPINIHAKQIFGKIFSKLNQHLCVCKKCSQMFFDYFGSVEGFNEAFLEWGHAIPYFAEYHINTALTEKEFEKYPCHLIMHTLKFAKEYEYFCDYELNQCFYDVRNEITLEELGLEPHLSAKPLLSEQMLQCLVGILTLESGERTCSLPPELSANNKKAFKTHSPFNLVLISPFHKDHAIVLEEKENSIQKTYVSCLNKWQKTYRTLVWNGDRNYPKFLSARPKNECDVLHDNNVGTVEQFHLQYLSLYRYKNKPFVLLKKEKSNVTKEDDLIKDILEDSRGVNKIYSARWSNLGARMNECMHQDTIYIISPYHKNQVIKIEKKEPQHFLQSRTFQVTYLVNFPKEEKGQVCVYVWNGDKAFAYAVSKKASVALSSSRFDPILKRYGLRLSGDRKKGFKDTNALLHVIEQRWPLSNSQVCCLDELYSHLSCYSKTRLSPVCDSVLIINPDRKKPSFLLRKKLYKWPLVQYVDLDKISLSQHMHAYILEEDKNNPTFWEVVFR